MIGVTAVGAASSGTRLLARILDASPDIEGHHDATHGKVPAETEHVVVIVRDTEATDASYRENYGQPVDGVASRSESEAFIANLYPDALCVSYEDLVANPAAVIAGIAIHFGVEPWPCPEFIYDGNARWIRSTS